MNKDLIILAIDDQGFEVTIGEAKEWIRLRNKSNLAPTYL
jgi:hypothetical protein